MRVTDAGTPLSEPWPATIHESLPAHHNLDRWRQRLLAGRAIGLLLGHERRDIIRPRTPPEAPRKKGPEPCVRGGNLTHESNAGRSGAFRRGASHDNSFSRP